MTNKKKTTRRNEWRIVMAAVVIVMGINLMTMGHDVFQRVLGGVQAVIGILWLVLLMRRIYRQE